MDVRTALVRLQARAGVRLALVQAAIVIIAFALAGYLTQLSLERISQASIRAHVAGEAKSLDDEFFKKGAAHLPFTVAKRSRLWRGFDYRLVSPAGMLLAGRLPLISAHLGWDDLAVDVPGGAHHFLTFTKAMPDGSRLTVGQDKAVEAGEMKAVRQTLMICGVLGVMFCIAASYLFSRGTWRRIADVARAAHAVSSGDLQVRVDVHHGAPRDDVDELAEAFNAMLDRIGVLMVQVGQVSTDIAHDLRTPLTRFGQKLERLKMKVRGDPELVQAVATLETDISEILRTFDALLQLSAIEAAIERPQARLADLGEIAVRVSEAYRPDIEESGRRLDVQADDALIDGDNDLLAQGVANLLENALLHTPIGSSILVSVKRVGEDVTLLVEDNGAGIPIEQRQRVVKPFVRLEQSRHKPGSGLGLAIVAAVASRHESVLSLDDAQPGLRVTLRFPAARNHRSIMASGAKSQISESIILA